MFFKSIEINNFRNFENIKIELGNKNLFFGMNDVGKTNFLYALRFVFDRDIRKNQFLDSDYYRKNTDKPISILIEIDISDTDNEDSQKLRARMRGNITSVSDIVYIKLIGNYDKNDLFGNPILYWGNDINCLKEVPIHGIYTEIDYIFNIIFIDAYVDVYSLFKKKTNYFIKNKDTDSDILEEIKKDMKSLNCHISELSGVQDFERKITPEFKKYRGDDVSISIKSQIAIKGLYNNIVPYIKNDRDGELYPTSGEGRKKLLVYSIYDLLSEEYDANRINVFLIEEPENNLHKSLQKMLSNILFEGNKYRYLFMTTHSSAILSDMDNINLVRIFNDNKIDSKSYFYSIPKEYINLKKTFNSYLSEAIFADKVLLVEGPSEHILFEKVMSSIDYFYEVGGTYILPVGGIRFSDYYNILNSLGISCIIKTDNDLRKTSQGKYSVLGFSRINKLLMKDMLPIKQLDENSVEAKRRLYDTNKKILDDIRLSNKIYLSRCSLEEDLDEILHDSLIEYLPESNGDVVSYLKESKQFNIAELVKKLTEDDCKKIFEHYNFACLKEAIKQ